MNKATASLWITCLCLLLAACGKEASSVQQAQPRQAGYVVVVNGPLQYFAQRLLGPQSEVRLPAPAEGDPAMWHPGIDEIQELQGADLVLLNGAGYSPWVTQISLPDNRLVVTAADRGRWIALQDQVTHSHGPEGEHAHGGHAFTTWMDFSLAADQVVAASDALQKRYPEQAADIARQEQSLVAELQALDAGFEAAAAELQGRKLVYSHPVYQYFEVRYGMAGLSLHWEPDTMPGEEQWSQLPLEDPSALLFVWEGEPLDTITERMAALGVQQLTLNPGANHRGDWLELQRRNLEALQAAAVTSR